jgi:ribosomal protein S18 acetylase RimI-like enzyme
MIPVTQSDADEVARLDALLFPENCFNEKTLATEIALGFGWVIYNEMDLVGYVLVRDDKLYLDVIRLGVHPAFQGQHLGSAMLKKVLGKNRDTMLTVREGNDIALRLYLKYGFQLVGRLHDGLGWVLSRPANGASW